MRLCITYLSVGQDLAYVIHRSLNRVGLPFFFSFSDEDCTDHIGGGRDVEEELFLRDWWSHDGCVVKDSLRASNVFWASSSHTNLSAFFNSFKKGKLFSSSFLMKRPRAAIIHVSFMTSFLLDGLAILRIASTFVGFASMPRCPTIKPRSNPEGTPNTHLVGLSFHWNSRRLAKVPLRSDELIFHGSLDDYIVYVGFNVLPDL
jgi:hypothetical protein